jgi:hypothetical protein
VFGGGFSVLPLEMELLGTRLFLIRMKTVSNNYCEKVPY